MNAKICSRRKSCTTRCSKDVEPLAAGTGTDTGEPVSVKRGGEVVRPGRRDGHASAQKNVITNSHKNEEEEEKKKAVEVSPLNWDVVDEREGAEQPTTPNDSRNPESTVPFIPARGPVKKRVDDPFDKGFVAKLSAIGQRRVQRERGEGRRRRKRRRRRGGRRKARRKLRTRTRKGRRKMNEKIILEFDATFIAVSIQSPPTLVEIVPAASSDDDEEQTPRESKMLSKPLYVTKR